MPKNKSFINLFWSFIDNVSQQFLNFIVGIVLANLLMPEEFGLVGIVMVFIAISNVFVDGGFSAALINKKKADKIDFNTIFFTNMTISIIIYLILFISAEWIAEQFGKPEVKNLLRLAGLNVILISLELIHRTIFIRNLNFRVITFVSFLAVLISSFCGILMAYNGLGVYSLVFRFLIGSSISVILFWTLNKWRPSLSFSVRSLKEMFSYGVNLLSSNILNTLQLNIYNLLIGKFYGTAMLGYYTRATIFRDLFSSNISTIVKKVSFSTLSKIEDKKLKLSNFLFFRKVAYLFVCLATLVLFCTSKEIILIILSDKWLYSANILSITSVAGVFIVLYNLNIDYLAVLGNTKLYLNIEIVGKILIIPIILLGIFSSFDLFLYSIVIHSFATFLIANFELNQIIIHDTMEPLFSSIIKYLSMLFIISILDYFNSYRIIFDNIYASFCIKLFIVIIIFSIFHMREVTQILKKFKQFRI